MLMQKMAQNRDELSGVGHVMPLHGCSDIINDHVADRLRPMLAVKQVVPQRGSNDLRDVLMLTNGLDLLRREVAETDTIVYSIFRSGCIVAGGLEVVGAFDGCEGIEQRSDRGPEALNGAFGGFA